MDDRPHCQRFDELPEHTKLFLEALTPEEIVAIKEIIPLARAAKTMGRFWKWTFILIVSVFTGMAALGQSIDWLWNRIRGE